MTKQPDSRAYAVDLMKGEGKGSQDSNERLQALEAVIERGAKIFIEVGAALLEIRDARLYRKTHSSFEDYCRERWGVSRVHAHRVIGASEIAKLLPPGNTLPNERVARELARLRHDPPLLAKAWEQILNDYGPEPTASQVRDVVRLMLSQWGRRGVLAQRFIVPPFSVLDARSGVWQARKRMWLAMGWRSELGRGSA